MKRNEECAGSHEKTIKIVHKGVYKETKICLTCNVVKPFRSHHCSDCDNCIIRFDHHCPWIGGCVGIRNYIYFFIFLCILNLKDIFIGIFCIIHIIYIYKEVPNEEKVKNWVASHLVELIPTLLTIIFIGCTMSFTFGLWIYHLKLIIKNLTTKDEIKKLIFEKIGNPYDKGIKSNCKNFYSRHKTMNNEFTVKDLRAKVKKQEIKNIQNNVKINNNHRHKPITAFSTLSKREQQLKNKNKKVIDENNNNKIDKKDSNQNKELDDEIDNISINDEKSEEIQNNNQLFNKIKEKIKNKEKDKDKENKGIILKKRTSNKNKEKELPILKKRNNNPKNDNNKIKNKTDFKTPKKIEDDFSIDDDISDENDNTNSKICNTSYKNKSNLDKNFIDQINDIESNQIKAKNLLNSLRKNEKGYQLAQKRLEELSSEITINQEKNSSISIPNENSFSDALSQS